MTITVTPNTAQRTLIRQTVEATMIDTAVVTRAPETVNSGEVGDGSPTTPYTGKCRVYSPGATPRPIVVGGKVVTLTDTYVYFPAGSDIKPQDSIAVTSVRTGLVTTYRADDDLDHSEEYQRRVRVKKVG